MSVAQSHRGRVAALTRSRPADDPELIEARRSLKLARLEDYITKQVNEWPPLTEDQKIKVSSLLTPSLDGGDAA